MRIKSAMFTAAVVALLAPLGCRSGGTEAPGESSRSGARRPAPPADGEPPWQIERPAPATAEVDSQPLPSPGPTLVKQGRAPLVYIVEAPATVSVADLTTQRPLARAEVPARTIVRIEVQGGVILGAQRIVAGPLPPEHEYGIYLEADNPSEMRNQRIAPAPGRRPGQPLPQRRSP